MSYSRRQLYAMGEPLGESATHLKPGGRVYGGGGSGGGGSSTGTQTSITELPEWARPYAKDILSKGQALTDTEQNPYQQYGGERIAGFQPLQQQAFNTVGGMNAGPQGFQQNVGSYMSPYMQNVVDVEKREAGRQSGIMGTQQQAQATQAGAFGGARDALQRAERERNLAQQMGDIQSRGSQAAYESAANQFRQGITQQSGLAQLQGQLGAQQQQQAQRPLDLAYQDFQNQQNYPYKQLGFMSDLLRGTPTGSSSTVNMYQPGPSGLQSLAGLGMGAYGLSKMGMFAEGGQIGVQDEEPVIRYADGGGVTSRGNVDSIIEKLSPEQLQQARENALHRRDMDTVDAIDERMAALAQTKSLTSGLGSAFDQIPADQQEQMMADGGIIAMAGGGSYKQKTDESLKGLSDLVTDYTPQTSEEYQAGVEKQMPFVEKMYGPDATAGYLEEIKAKRAGLGKNMDEAKGIGALLAAAEMIGARNLSQGAAGAAKVFTGAVANAAKENREADDRLRQSEITLATAQQARKEGMVSKASSLEDKAEAQKQKGKELKINAQEKIATLNAGLAGHEMQANATIAGHQISAGKETDLARQTRIRYDSLIEQGNPANKQTLAKAAAMAASDVGRYPGEEKAAAAREGVDAKFQSRVDKALESNMPYIKAVQKGNTQEAARIRQGVVAELTNAAPAAQAAPASAPVPQATAPVAAPPLNTWMAAAKKTNPGVSDADLAAYYNQKYGK
jgi:hypothetical protein